jgi:hypothetical protein
VKRRPRLRLSPNRGQAPRPYQSVIPLTTGAMSVTFLHPCRIDQVLLSRGADLHGYSDTCATAKVLYYLQSDGPHRLAAPFRAKGEHVGSSATTGCRCDSLAESLGETAVIPLAGSDVPFRGCARTRPVSLRVQPWGAVLGRPHRTKREGLYNPCLQSH